MANEFKLAKLSNCLIKYKDKNGNGTFDRNGDEVGITISLIDTDKNLKYDKFKVIGNEKNISLFTPEELKNEFAKEEYENGKSTELLPLTDKKTMNIKMGQEYSIGQLKASLAKIAPQTTTKTTTTTNTANTFDFGSILTDMGSYSGYTSVGSASANIYGIFNSLMTNFQKMMGSISSIGGQPTSTPALETASSTDSATGTTPAESTTAGNTETAGTEDSGASKTSTDKTGKSGKAGKAEKPQKPAPKTIAFNPPTIYKDKLDESQYSDDTLKKVQQINKYIDRLNGTGHYKSNGRLRGHEMAQEIYTIGQLEAELNATSKIYVKGHSKNKQKQELSSRTFKLQDYMPKETDKPAVASLKKSIVEDFKLYSNTTNPSEKNSICFRILRHSEKIKALRKIDDLRCSVRNDDIKGQQKTISVINKYGVLMDAGIQKSDIKSYMGNQDYCDLQKIIEDAAGTAVLNDKTYAEVCAKAKRYQQAK